MENGFQVILKIFKKLRKFKIGKKLLKCTVNSITMENGFQVILKIFKKLRKFKICIEQLKCTSIQAFLSSSNLFKPTQ